MRQQHISRQSSGQESAWILILLLAIAVFALLLVGGGGLFMWQRQRAMQAEAIMQLERARMAEVQAMAMAAEAEAAQNASALDAAPSNAVSQSAVAPTIDETNASADTANAGNLLALQLEAWNSGKIAQLMQYFVQSDDTLIVAAGQRFSGLPEIEKYLSSRLDAVASEELSWSNLSERRITDDLIVVVSTLESTSVNQEVATTFLRGKDGQWKISQQVFSSKEN